jgi:hypothetical protein
MITDTTIKPFASIDRALLALLTSQPLQIGTDPAAPAPEAQVGGDFAYEPTMPWFIRIDKVPGGRSDWYEGDFVVDVEVFAPDYLLAESVAFAIEALLLGYPHVVEVDGRKVVFDEVSQNASPAELPWEDDSVSRLGSTYVITARRR